MIPLKDLLKIAKMSRDAAMGYDRLPPNVGEKLLNELRAHRARLLGWREAELKIPQGDGGLRRVATYPSPMPLNMPPFFGRVAGEALAEAHRWCELSAPEVLELPDDPWQGLLVRHDSLVQNLDRQLSECREWLGQAQDQVLNRESVMRNREERWERATGKSLAVWEEGAKQRWASAASTGDLVG